MKKKLDKMYEKGLGKPPGILKWEPNREHCYTKYNHLPRGTVPFKPMPYATGCTYLDMNEWP